MLDKILFKKIVRLDNFSLWKGKVLYLLNDYPRISNDYLTFFTSLYLKLLKLENFLLFVVFFCTILNNIQY